MHLFWKDEEIILFCRDLKECLDFDDAVILTCIWVCQNASHFVSLYNIVFGIGKLFLDGFVLPLNKCTKVHKEL